jgi:2-oxo-4-hydroxy-4-carboxy-5-ureidoimidazoline decarboxylase
MNGALASFNAAPADVLRRQLLALTGAPQWADALLAGRPYADVAEVLARSEEILHGVGEDQIDAALAGHPRIGEKAAHLDAGSAARSAREQSGMDQADAIQRQELAAANIAYEKRFGRIYLVAAAGLSAAELVAKAQARLHNDPDTELDVVRGELARITTRRLDSLLAEEVL